MFAEYLFVIVINYFVIYRFYMSLSLNSVLLDAIGNADYYSTFVSLFILIGKFHVAYAKPVF